MSKVLVLGDLHLGARGDSLDFLNYFNKFFEDILFPYIEVNKISNVILLGDLFDKRKTININTFHLSKESFFDKLSSICKNVYIILGNHDVYFRQSLKVNSPSILLESYKNFKVISEPSTITINREKIDMIPWICDENKENILEFIENSSSKICMGHFEFSGFEMDKGNVFMGGSIDKSLFQKYLVVLSGHFHHKSSDNHIYYLGTPYEITWADYDDLKGFHVIDLKTKNIEFIENPYSIFKKIVYDDVEQDIEYWKNFNYEELSNVYVKLMVMNKNDEYLFDVALDMINKANSIQLAIIEDIHRAEIVEEEVNEAEDTYSVLCKYVDTQKLEVDPSVIKVMMKDIYLESLSNQRD